MLENVVCFKNFGRINKKSIFVFLRFLVEGVWGIFWGCIKCFVDWIRGYIWMGSFRSRKFVIEILGNFGSLGSRWIK